MSSTYRETACIILLLCAATIASHAQTFTRLVSFNGTDGSGPYYMTLVQGQDGNLYGTTARAAAPTTTALFSG